MSVKDSLGDRMKRYENVYRQTLVPRTPAILRLDGRAFHTYTKGLDKPFDGEFMAHMDWVMVSLASEIQGVVFGYTQSDGISFVLQDFATLETQPWFGGNIQKIVSVSASYATMQLCSMRGTAKMPTFDARVFNVPTMEEAANYLIWRQRDCERNSIQMAAQSMFSHKQLQGLSSNQVLDLMAVEKNVCWEDYYGGFKFGRMVYRSGDFTTYKCASAPRFNFTTAMEMLTI